jgi:hypothetical protein
MLKYSKRWEDKLIRGIDNVIFSNHSGREYSAKLDGKTWLRYSISIWDDVKTADERAYGHPVGRMLDMGFTLICVSNLQILKLSPLPGSR